MKCFAHNFPYVPVPHTFQLPIQVLQDPSKLAEFLPQKRPAVRDRLVLPPDSSPSQNNSELSWATSPHLSCVYTNKSSYKYVANKINCSLEGIMISNVAFQTNNRMILQSSFRREASGFLVRMDTAFHKGSLTLTGNLSSRKPHNCSSVATNTNPTVTRHRNPMATCTARRESSLSQQNTL